MENFLQSIETFQLGGEVSALKETFTQDLRDRLAYHESGHALVGHWLKAGIVERVTMLKHGMPDLRPFYESDIRWLRHYGFSPLAPTMLHEGV